MKDQEKFSYAFWNEKFDPKKHNYRCCRCQSVKGDHGRWVTYKRTRCVVCQACAHVLKGKAK